MGMPTEWDILPHFVSCLHGIYLELLENTPRSSGGYTPV